jgi:hypothetical protein
MEEIGFGPIFVQPDAGRIAIPARYSKRILWLSDSKPLNVWLLMLQPGRFRLLSDGEVTANEEINAIKSLIVDGPEISGISATVFDSPERAVLIGRLIPTTLSQSLSSGWRLSIPRRVAPRDQTLVLLFSQGRLEIWLLEPYHAALAHPLSSLL